MQVGDRQASNIQFWKLTIRLPNKYKKALFDAQNQEGDSFNTIIKNAVKRYLKEEFNIKVGDR